LPCIFVFSILGGRTELAGFHSNVSFRRIGCSWLLPFRENGLDRITASSSFQSMVLSEWVFDKESHSTLERHIHLNAAQTDAGLIRHTQFRRAGCASWE
jgi:abortive infection bacteriophage resistance protein